MAARTTAQGCGLEPQPADVPEKALQDPADGAQTDPHAVGGRSFVFDALSALTRVQQGGVAARARREHRSDAGPHARPGGAAGLFRPDRAIPEAEAWQRVDLPHGAGDFREASPGAA